MRQAPGVCASWAELGLHGVERQRGQLADRVQAEQLQALQHVGLEEKQVSH